MKRTSLKRKTELKRTGPITRAGSQELRRNGTTKPKRRRSRQRLREEYARKYGSEERVRKIKAMPCAVPSCNRTPCDNAHTANEGMGRKGSWRTIVPLCSAQPDGFPGHHYIRDSILGSNELFKIEYKVDLENLAAHLAETVQP